MKRVRKNPSRPLALPLRLGLFVLMFLAVLMIGARVQDVFAELAHGRAPEAFTPVRAAEEPEKHAAGDAAKAAPAEADGEKKGETGKSTEGKADDKAAADKKDEAGKNAEGKADDKAAAGKKDEAGKGEDKKGAAAAPDVTPPKMEEPAAEKPAGNKEDHAAGEEDDLTNLGSVDEGLDLTESEITVLRHLSDRRKELDKKTRALDQKETLLNLTEQRVDKKISELKNMQEEIRKVLGKAESDHTAQVASMVKIYETMKPKDAAKIFETMEIPTLVEVISRMKESKAAPVLAAMDAAKAKEVSTQMMTKKDLPKAP